MKATFCVGTVICQSRRCKTGRCSGTYTLGQPCSRRPSALPSCLPDPCPPRPETVTRHSCRTRMFERLRNKDGQAGRVLQRTRAGSKPNSVTTGIFVTSGTSAERLRFSADLSSRNVVPCPFSPHLWWSGLGLDCPRMGLEWP